MKAERNHFLAGGGGLGALMRSKPWAETELGPAEKWPQSLRTAVSILLNSRYPMFIFWGPRLIKIYNDGYRPILGDKHPWALGRPGPEVWPEIWNDIGPMVQRVMSGGEATWSEDLKLFMHRRGFAEEVYFTFSYSPIRDESGGIGGMFCACTETTAKVLGERRLKILRDLAAGPRRARTVEEARALSLTVLRAHPADVAAALDADGELVLAPSPNLVFDDEYRGFFDLVRRQVVASIAAAGEREAERRRADALAEIDRAKTAFFSNVSHEFRTPLTLMLGPVEDGLQDREAPLPPAQRERLDLVRRNGLRLQKLVNSLLDFSRIEAGRVQASYVPTDLAALTADLASSFRSALEKAGLKLAVDCPPLTQAAYVDPDMWEKIVLNLLSNALKATFEGEIGVSLRLAGDRILLAVSDTGTGIPADDLPHVFERFRRVEGARSRTHEGTGIGLALVSELVRLHGGTVSAESRLGRGSTFVVSIPAGKAHLPADRIGAERTLVSTALGAEAFVEEALRWLPAAPVARPPEPAGEATGPRERIVWADDNADMRDYVQRLLAPRYEVTAVADGRAALEAIRASRPDLVLCDVMMPGVDGLALVKALRADPATRSLPVILLSARAGEESRIEGYDAGADDYVYKPFTARELLARISARLELTRLEGSLAAERAALATLFAQTPIPTAVLRGPDLVFEMCNPAYVAVVGGRDVTGKTFFEALPEVRDQGFDAQLREVMRTGTPYVGRETPVRLRRGGVLEDTYFTYIYAPLREADGSIERVIAIVNEVTEQVAARRKVEESEERYRSIFESIDEGFCVVQMIFDEQERVSDYRFLEANPAFGRHTGLTDAVGKTARELVPDLDEFWFRTYGEVARTGKAARFESYAAAMGERWFDVYCSRVGRPEDRKVAIVFQDVTGRKRAEEALRAADVRKDEFLAVLSHELRNPLAPIRNAVTLLQADGDGSIRREMHGVLDRQVSHLIRLVDDLLDVARIGRGDIGLQKRAVTLAEVLAAAMETSRPRVESGGHELVLDFPDPTPILFADPVRVAQVISNLLNNAAAYTPHGGRIDLAVRAGDGWASIVVRDNGVGIAPEGLAALFGMFNRGDVARHHPSGFGIGLALARRLVEMHGGTLEAASEGIGKGAAFTVRLPLAPGAPAARDAAPVDRAIAPKRILVVDDNRDAAESLCGVLKVLGNEVQVARDGPSALEEFRVHDPSIVILDIGMPGMSGYDVAREIRARFPERTPQLIALTGWGQEADRRLARDAGFDHHLVKPAEIGALESLLASIQ